MIDWYVYMCSRCRYRCAYTDSMRWRSGVLAACYWSWDGWMHERLGFCIDGPMGGKER